MTLTTFKLAVNVVGEL